MLHAVAQKTPNQHPILTLRDKGTSARQTGNNRSVDFREVNEKGCTGKDWQKECKQHSFVYFDL